MSTLVKKRVLQEELEKIDLVSYSGDNYFHKSPSFTYLFLASHLLYFDTILFLSLYKSLENLLGWDCNINLFQEVVNLKDVIEIVDCISPGEYVYQVNSEYRDIIFWLGLHSPNNSLNLDKYAILRTELGYSLQNIVKTYETSNDFLKLNSIYYSKGSTRIIKKFLTELKASKNDVLVANKQFIIAKYLKSIDPAPQYSIYVDYLIAYLDEDYETQRKLLDRLTNYI